MTSAVLPTDCTHSLDPAGAVEIGIEDWLQIMRAEYLEMPGLHLTARQARRLWNLDAELCDALLDMLIADRFLRKTPNGAYARTEEIGQ